MRNSIGVAALGAVLLSLTLIYGWTPPAAAQESGNCRQVEVLSVRLRRVDLYSLRGAYDRTVARNELGTITAATECDAAPEFLRVDVAGRRWLVRRSALQLQQSIELPLCADARHDSGESRNASSSGIGGAACRTN